MYLCIGFSKLLETQSKRYFNENIQNKLIYHEKTNLVLYSAICGG